MYQGDIDPEIAALLDGDVFSVPNLAPSQSAAKGKLDLPPIDEASQEEGVVSVDVTVPFPKIDKKLQEKSSHVFDNAEYYKKALSGEGDTAQRIHGLLQKYLNAKDPKDKGVYRQQIVSAYWDFLASIAKKASGTLPAQKRFTMRFSILHPALLSAEDRALFGRIFEDDKWDQPIRYLDEWLKAIGSGALRPSITDEVRIAKSNEQARLQQLLNKASGKKDGALNLLRAKHEERSAYENALMEKARFLSEHTPLPGFPGIGCAYVDSQKRVFGEIQDILKNLSRCDRELLSYIQDYDQASGDVDSLEEKVNESGGDVAVDIHAIDTEFESVKQMAKLTIGRQGNHFPILTREYFRSGPNEIATRENVLEQLAWIESIDPEAFHRSYKNRQNRIVPFVLLLPTYGDYGICWEPFDRYNRATSRGRIVIPMYSKSLQAAILSAVADLRWQVAKEKASYYWMEEGLTGNYYQWFVSKKLKGDIKEYFIQDYVLWITKESDAVQKMEKEVRSIFWRFIPFSQTIKEKLKGRSYIYQELYQRDVNRSLSDGY